MTPYLPEFWTYAEREQVASMRHPPHDVRLIEWKERLDLLNGSRPFEERGFDVDDELDKSVGRLSLEALVEMRDRYGATHYVTKRLRKDLEHRWLFAAGRYDVYSLSGLSIPAKAGPSPGPAWPLSPANRPG